MKCAHHTFAILLLLMLGADVGHAAHSYWDPQVQYDKKGSVGSFESAASDAEGDYATSDTFEVQRAGINAYSDQGMWWDNTYFIYRVTGQDRDPGWASANLPRTGGSGNDHYFGWDTDIEVDLLSGITYRGSYTLAYCYEYRDGLGQYRSTTNYPTFSVTNGHYLCNNASGGVSQNAFDGGATKLTGAYKLVKQGGSILTLDNAANDYSLNTYIDKGTISATANAFGLGDILVGPEGGADDAILQIGASGVDVGNDITIRAGTGTKYLQGVNAAGTGTFSGAVTLNDDVVIDHATGSGNLAVSGPITMGANAIGVRVNNTITLGAISGSGALTKEHGYGGSIVVTGAWNFGNTYINDGTVRIGAGGDIQGGEISLGSEFHNYDTVLDLASDGVAIGQTIRVEYGGGAETRTLRSSAAGTTTVSGDVWLRDKDLIVDSDAGSTLVLSGTVDMDQENNDQNLYITDAGDVTISGTINADSGSSAIEMDGSGTLTISGNNSGQSYQLNLSGGTTVMGGDSTFGTSYHDKINFNTANSTLRVTADASPSGLGMHIADNVTPTFEVDNGVVFTVGGVITDDSGTSAIIKTGNGTLALGGNNNYNGSTTVSAGKLLVNGAQTGNGICTVAAEATLGGSGTYPNNVTISADGKIEAVNDSATENLDITGALTFSGAATITVDISGTSADQINVSGAILAGGGVGAITVTPDVVSRSGTEWTILTGSSVPDADQFASSDPDYAVQKDGNAIKLAFVGVLGSGTTVFFR